MNGDVYEATWRPSPGADSETSFPFNWRDRPEEDQVEYIDVYSGLISTTYGEVYWKPVEERRFPEEIIKRFDGKVMAIYGVEYDQVYRSPDGDKSVPMTVTYNHHGNLKVLGKTAKTEIVQSEADPDTTDLPRTETADHE